MRIKRSIVVILIVAGCTQSANILAANILLIPKNKQGEYCVAKAAYNTWAGEKTINLFDKNNNVVTCSGKSHLIEQKSFSCKDKKYNVHLTCFHSTKVDLTYSLKESCREAYGIALTDTGREYEVYMGISDEVMKTKIEEYESSR
jgi:hypothetical protein